MPAATRWPEGRGTKPTIHPPPFFCSHASPLIVLGHNQNIRSPKADSSTFEERFLYLASVTFMLPNSAIPHTAYDIHKNKTGTNRIGFVPVILTFI